MNRIQFNEAQQKLEALNISGSIVIDIDDKPPIKLSFSQKLRIYFDVTDKSQYLTTEHYLQGQAKISHKDVIKESQNCCVADSLTLSEVVKDSFSGDSDCENARFSQEKSILPLPQTESISQYGDLKFKQDVHMLSGDFSEAFRDTASHDQQEICVYGEDQTKNEAEDKLLQSRPCTADDKCVSNQQPSKLNKTSNSDVSTSKANEKDGVPSNQSPLQFKNKCLYCHKIFSSKARLAAHNRVPKCINQCQKCGEDFLSAADLFHHQFKKYDSDFMAQQYPLLSIKKRSDCLPTQCPLCKINFQKASNVLRHLQGKHFSDASYICCLCDKYFKTSSVLQSHMKNYCSNCNGQGSVLDSKSIKKSKTQGASKKKISPSIGEEEPEKQNCNCSGCMVHDEKIENFFEFYKEVDNAEVVRKSQTQLYEQSEPGYIIKSEDVPLDKPSPATSQLHSSSFNTAASSTQGEVLMWSKESMIQSDSSCSYCHRSFASLAQKEAHHRVPQCLRKCKECKEEFLCAADLFVHQFRKHNKHCLEEQFPSFTISRENQFDDKQCPICNEKAISETVHRHIQSKHFSDESFSCCVCQSRFKTSSCLKYHLEKHCCRKRKFNLEDKPFLNFKADRKVCSPFSLKKQAPSHFTQRSAKIFDQNTGRKSEEGHQLCDDGLLSSQDSDRSTISSKLDNDNEELTETPDEKCSCTCKCKHCGKVFSNQFERNMHKKVPPIKIKCPKCPCTFTSQASLIIHNFQAHEREFHEEMSKSSLSGFGKCKSNFDKKTLNRCPLCWKTPLKLREHVALLHTGEMLYQCCICGKKLNSAAKLNRHCDDHLNGRKGKFQCSKCPTVTNSHSEFFKHAATHRTQCIFCDIDFGHTHLLWSHYKSEHADRLFTCHLCGKKIATQAQLNSHMRHHRFTYLKPCPICGIMIKGNSCLERHMKRMHHVKKEQTGSEKEGMDKIGGEQSATHDQPDNQYLCSECPMIFPTHHSLKLHLRTHSRHRIPCPTCNKTFTTNSILTRHIDRVHLNISSYTCDICGKKATSGYNLKVHKRIHSATKHFFCDICGQGFNYKASLQGHMRSKHREEEGQGGACVGTVE